MRRSLRASIALAILIFVLPLSAASITEIVPAAAPHGARVLVAGSGFDAAAQVSFTGPGGTRIGSPITARSATLLEISVPATAISGTVRVDDAELPFSVMNDPSWSKVTTLPSTLKTPSAMAMLPSGSIAIADTLHHQIVIVSPSGASNVIAGSGKPGFADGRGSGAQFHEPSGLAYDAARGLLYVSDKRNDAIRTIDATGNVNTLARGFNRPAGLAVDAAGNVLVADAGNNRIALVSPAGVVTTLAGGMHGGFADGSVQQALFNKPEGIALGSDATIYVADTKNNVIRAIAAGQVTTICGTGHGGFVNGNAAVAEINDPSGVTLDDAGNLYIADRQNHAIRMLTTNGQVVTLAGSGKPAFADGAPANATFKQPAAIIFAGALYVADSGNDALRAIYPAVDITAVWRRTGKTTGGDEVRLFGSGFVAGATEVLFGTMTVEAAFVSSNELRVIAPAGNDGSVDLSVRTPAGSDTLRNAYTYLPPPSITNVQPRRGAEAGGDAVVIAGSNFTEGDTTVTFGGMAAADVVVSSANQIQATTPAGNGVVDVVVTTTAGSATLSGGFTYLPPPAIDSVTPAKGPVAGGTLLTIVGRNFVSGGDTRVSIGGTQVSATFVSESKLTIITPAADAGNAAIAVTTPGGTSTEPASFTYVAPPRITGFTPTTGGAGTVVVISGENFDPESGATLVSFNGVAAIATNVTPASIVTSVPSGATTGPILVTTIGGEAMSGQSFTIGSLVQQITVKPDLLILSPGSVQRFTATATSGDGTVSDVSALVTWGSSNAAIVAIAGDGRAEAKAVGRASISAVLFGISGRAEVEVAADAGTLPDPSTIAPPINATVATSVGDSTTFLYTGPGALQSGVTPGAIDTMRSSVVRGRALNADGFPLPGVKITVAARPQYGQTLTRGDGMFDLAVNGGETVTIRYTKSGFIAVDRTVAVRWHDFANVPDVVLTAYDDAVTAVSLNAATQQSARGSVVTDDDGARQATLVIPAGTGATMRLPNGTIQTLATAHIRATEYTVGSRGPQAMPAVLPPASGYTYCVELSVDEAVAAGAQEVTFSAPLALYVDNFLDFPAGMIVPAGYYDRTKQAWIPSKNGVVVKIVSIDGGQAAIDANGDDQPDAADALQQLGVTLAERQYLATTYAAGKTLWRVPVTHFTPWDCNWPYAPPPGSVPPSTPAPSVDSSSSSSSSASKKCGSIVDCERQTLGEKIEVPGTPFSLHYQSERTAGNVGKRMLHITATGATIPPNVKNVELTVSVAGQVYKTTFPALPNLKTDFLWNGRDVYGRPVQGAQSATVSVGYVYPALYTAPLDFEQAFASAGGAPITRNPTRNDLTIWQQHSVDVSNLDVKEAALGGWTLDAHHLYDPQHRVLVLGDGKTKKGGSMHAATVVPFAGGGPNACSCFRGDGGPAVDASFYYPEGIVMAPDGTVYVSDMFNHRIRAIGTDGIIRTIAGNGAYPDGSEGKTALQTPVFPGPLRLGPDGSLYWTEQLGGDVVVDRVRRLSPDGIIRTVAGRRNATGYSGDGDPATEASLQYPYGLAVAPDGTLYIGDRGNRVVRRVTPGGIISTFAGIPGVVGGTTGDGGPATQATLFEPRGIAIGPDGSVYIGDIKGRIRKVTPDGIIHTIAGGGTNAYADGLPATSINNVWANDLWVNPNGSVYLTSGFHIREINAQGIINTIAGNSTRDWDPPQNGGSASKANFAGLNTFAVAPDGSIYTTETTGFRVRRIVPPIPGVSHTDLTIASDNESEVFVFDSRGRHKKTIDANNGQQRYAFGYDGAGRLSSVTTATGTVAIERGGNGTPSAIVGPGGERTAIGTDGNGYVNSVAAPGKGAITMTYASDGLMKSITDGRGGATSFTYDEDGRLKGESGGGSSIALTRTGSTTDYKVVLTESGGRSTQYEVKESPKGAVQQTITDMAGLVTKFDIDASGTTSNSTLPDGTRVGVSYGGDPRFGLQAQTLQTFTINTPRGQSYSMSHGSTATLSDQKNPFSVTSFNESYTLNSRTYSATFDKATGKLTMTSPAGRQQLAFFDSGNRVVRTQEPGATPTVMTYNGLGLVDSVTEGARSASFVYDGSGNLTDATDSLGRPSHYVYDSAGRVTEQTLPGGRVIHYGYDGSGNLTTVTPPARPAHVLSYNDAQRLASYTPPGGGTTTFSYTADHNLVSIARPDGQTIGFSYDAVGRNTGITAPGVATTFAYDASTGNITTATSNGVTMTYDYDGFLVTGTTWSGAVSGSVSFALNRDFRAQGEFVNGTNFISMTYDNDGLLTNAGQLKINRDTASGFITGTTLLTTADAWTYNEFGELSQYNGIYNALPAYTLALGRDGAGRITTKTESMYGSALTTTYQYDVAGRLQSVDTAGSVATFEYDDNGNRTKETSNGQTVDGTVDNRDRLLTHGATSFTYNAAGDVTSRTIGTQTTTYEYDSLSNLRKVTLPNDTVIEYLLDADGRRVGRKMNGVLTNVWLYTTQTRIAAELNGSGTVVARFVYGTHANVPNYMIRNNVSYRIFSDNLGSPRLVVNATTGQVAQMIGYDAHGNVLDDTAPGFQPFGFAGGLWDSSTRLVRFGARDYDPRTGRWMTTDPIHFRGQDTNLYAYVFGDPVNLVDWEGLRFLTEKEGQKITREAATWTGTPYYSGGGAKSTKGTDGKADCSGSVWGIYRNSGYPYDYKASRDFPSTPSFRPVPGNKPQVGDVAWWNGHMAIYDPNAAEAKGAPKGSEIWSARRPGKPFGPTPLKWFTDQYGSVKYYRYWIPDGAPAAAPTGAACACPIKK